MQIISKISLFFLLNTVVFYAYAINELSEDEYSQGEEEDSSEDSQLNSDDSLIQKIIVILCKKYNDKLTDEENEAIIAIYDANNSVYNFFTADIYTQKPDEEYSKIIKNLGIDQAAKSKKFTLGVNKFYLVNDSRISVREITKNSNSYVCKNPVLAVNIASIFTELDNGLVSNKYEFTSRTNNIKLNFDLSILEAIKNNLVIVKKKFKKIY